MPGAARRSPAAARHGPARPALPVALPGGACACTWLGAWGGLGVPGLPGSAWQAEPGAPGGTLPGALTSRRWALCALLVARAVAGCDAVAAPPLAGPRLFRATNRVQFFTVETSGVHAFLVTGAGTPVGGGAWIEGRVSLVQGQARRPLAKASRLLTKAPHCVLRPDMPSGGGRPLRLLVLHADGPRVGVGYQSRRVRWERGELRGSPEQQRPPLRFHPPVRGWRRVRRRARQPNAVQLAAARAAPACAGRPEPLPDSRPRLRQSRHAQLISGEAGQRRRRRVAAPACDHCLVRGVRRRRLPRRWRRAGPQPFRAARGAVRARARVCQRRRWRLRRRRFASSHRRGLRRRQRLPRRGLRGGRPRRRRRRGRRRRGRIRGRRAGRGRQLLRNKSIHQPASRSSTCTTGLCGSSQHSSPPRRPTA